MRQIIFFLFMVTGLHSFADTMEHFMNIANNIPQMEMKADPQSQAWARSARTVLSLTCDSIVETLILANDTAKAHGNPLFCLPAGTQINSAMLNDIIVQTYKDSSSQQSDKDRMTVSQVALMGLSKQYPCTPQGAQQVQGQQQTQVQPFQQAKPFEPAPAFQQQPQAQASTASGGFGGIAPPTTEMAHVSGSPTQ